VIVTINDEKIDVVLEHEKTLGEMLEGTERWLEGQGMSIVAIVADGKNIAADEIESSYGRELASITQLSLTTVSQNELYAEALANAIGHIEGRIQGGSAPFEETPAGRLLAEKDPDILIAVTSHLKDSGTGEKGPILDLLASRQWEARAPMDALAALKDGLEILADKLEALPLELQMGKDASASATLLTCGEALGSLIRLVGAAKEWGLKLDEIHIENQPFPLFIDELLTTLKELIAAKENGDGILVGDLAEYELAPRIRAIGGVIRGFGEGRTDSKGEEPL